MKALLASALPWKASGEVRTADLALSARAMAMPVELRGFTMTHNRTFRVDAF
jgi:hypothetical protein